MKNAGEKPVWTRFRGRMLKSWLKRYLPIVNGAGTMKHKSQRKRDCPKSPFAQQRLRS